VYYVNREKTIYAAVIGSDMIEAGLKIVGAHIDSPRLDLISVRGALRSNSSGLTSPSKRICNSSSRRAALSLRAACSSSVGSGTPSPMTVTLSKMACCISASSASRADRN
ncbi:MAG: hypothetical protein IJI40_03750, partial [Firmicutes bacterium]|nr:hypothetical protein [Bacillota bacterium]